MMLVRYFFVGSFAAIVDVGIFGIAVEVFRVDWLFVSLASFIVATVVNYFLSIMFVFSSGVRFGKPTEISLVFAVSGIGLCLNQSILWLLIEGGRVDAIISKITATGIVFVWNYIARKWYVFRRMQ